MTTRALIKAIILLLALGIAAQAQSPDMTAPQLLSYYEYGRKNLLGAAEKLPAEHFGFRPTSDVRSVAELFGHIINLNYMACAALRNESNPNKENLEKTLKSRDEVIMALKASFELCDGAFKNLTDANLRDTFKSGEREIPKISPAFLLIIHNMEHYGNLVTYLRLKGIVPPSSEPPPQKQ